MVDQLSATVRILLGTGNGFFQPWVDYQVGIHPVAIATADFNGDGKADLVVASQFANTVLLLLGNGDGTFRSFTTLYSSGPTALAIGDFNNDGKMDLAVANSNSNTVSIWLGTGVGTFRPALDFRVGEGPAFITPGDFNGDGKLDLAVANFSSNNVSILLGTDTGYFEPILNFAAGLAPAGIALGDFNGDGKVDLAVVNATGSKSTGFLTTISLLLGNGNGTFRPPLTSVAGSKASFYPLGGLERRRKTRSGGGRPRFQHYRYIARTRKRIFRSASHFAVGKGPVWIELFDFGHAGAPDLIVANSLSDNLSVLSNLTAGNPR